MATKPREPLAWRTMTAEHFRDLGVTDLFTAIGAARSAFEHAVTTKMAPAMPAGKALVFSHNPKWGSVSIAFRNADTKADGGPDIAALIAAAKSPVEAPAGKRKT